MLFDIHGPWCFICFCYSDTLNLLRFSSLGLLGFLMLIIVVF